MEAKVRMGSEWRHLNCAKLTLTILAKGNEFLFTTSYNFSIFNKLVFYS